MSILFDIKKILYLSIRRKDRQYQRNLALWAFLNRGNIEGTNSSKICVRSVHIYALFYICVEASFSE